MIIRSAIALAACLSLAAAPNIAAAQSQSSAPAAASASASLGDIEARLGADGFRIVEIERYSNVIEVKGFDRNGLCVELYLDRRSGETLRRERDDSCGRGGRRGEFHRGFEDHHRGGDDHHGHGSRHGGDHD